MHEPVDAERSRQLEASWVTNADAWTCAVQAGAILSRRAGTDAAILAAIERLPPGRVLDVGCGEGWLSRAMASAGRAVTGIDASAPLIETARAANARLDPAQRPRFSVCTYAELPDQLDELGAPFTAAICNFALLDADLGAPLQALHRALAPAGTLIIQTVHPFAALANGPYEDGWREEDFASFATPFPATMPWYFRTVGSWLRSVLDAGFTLQRVDEPSAESHPLPLSLLITATRR